MSSQEKVEQRAQYLRAIFDGIPLPTFIVYADVRIADLNSAAEQFLGVEAPSALQRRGGEAFHCIHAAGGCGQAEPCAHCVVRNSVKRAMEGTNTLRQLHQAHLRTETGPVAINLLVTTSLLPYTTVPQALLVLEDVTEIMQLRKGRTRAQGPGKRRARSHS